MCITKGYINPNAIERQGEIMAEIVVNEKGNKVVVIDKILFSSKRKIDWPAVEAYLMKYIGEEYVLDELDDIIYIGKDFPDEYANSKDSARALGTVGKAKANATQVIPELIKNATNITFQENKADKHKQNAKYGWYRCTVRFSLPTTNDKGEIVGSNAFQGRMVIRCDEDGKKYLYDIINIKKET